MVLTQPPQAENPSFWRMAQSILAVWRWWQWTLTCASMTTDEIRHCACRNPFLPYAFGRNGYWRPPA